MFLYGAKSSATPAPGDAILCAFCFFGILVLILFAGPPARFTVSRGVATTLRSIQNVESTAWSVTLSNRHLAHARRIERHPQQCAPSPTIRASRLFDGSRPLLC